MGKGGEVSTCQALGGQVGVWAITSTRAHLFGTWRHRLALFRVRVHRVGLDIGRDELKRVVRIGRPLEHNSHQRLRQMLVQVLARAVLLEDLPQLIGGSHRGTHRKRPKLVAEA